MEERINRLIKLGEDKKEIWDKLKNELNESNLQDKTVEILKNRGYDIYIQPDMNYGRPDIIATKKGKPSEEFKDEVVTEYLVIEVKGINDSLGEKLSRYFMGSTSPGEALLANKRFILVLPVIDGKDFEIWGLKQIYLQNSPPSRNS